MDRAWEALAAIVAGVLGVAIVAVLVGQRSQTSDVIQAGGSALSSIINAAVSPVVSTNNTFAGG